MQYPCYIIDNKCYIISDIGLAPRDFEPSPLTRAHVRLLGPYFKTGLYGAGPRPGGATRSGRTGGSPSRSTVAPEAGGPVPVRGRAGRGDTIPRPRGKRRSRSGARCKARTPGSRATFAPGPSRPTQSRSRRTAGGESAPGGGTGRTAGPGSAQPRLSGSPGPAGRPRRRVESSGRTARTPPVYLLTVSRPVELSLQSSFQLSLTVLVRYRSRAGI